VMVDFPNTLTELSTSVVVELVADNWVKNLEVREDLVVCWIRVDRPDTLLSALELLTSTVLKLLVANKDIEGFVVCKAIVDGLNTSLLSFSSELLILITLKFVNNWFGIKILIL
ncbi:15589_t:CDS:1, partial [Racocetra fulgida]